VEVPNVTRLDAVETTDIREDLLELSPQREGDFYRVPRILGEDG
jgi:aspartyl-tRNA(Asn)/glutamyl-tRNA(Gln) amidotransferase subunit C